MKRRLSKVRARTISQGAIDAFYTADAGKLHHELGLMPWAPSPLQVDGPLPPEWARNNGTAWTAAWPESWELRQRLDEACQ
jgi:hypothetical protein